MRILGKKTLTRIVRPLRSTLRPGGLVLGYHRISDEPWDPLGLSVRPSHFRQQLDMLRELYTPVSLRALTDALQLGADVRDYVALTFDDGYRDFIDNALPELERLDIPATIFVATGYSGKSFWWDDVVAALDPAYRDSSSLTLRWPGASGTQVYSNLDTRDGATRVIRELCRELSLCGADGRAQILEDICSDKRRNSDFLDTARPMSNEDIRGLARCSIVEVGSHTVSHRQLAHLAESEQVSEIQSSKRDLETLVADAIHAFSYPHGSISAHSRRHLEKSGFLYACTSREAVVRQETDAYALPRVWPRDVARKRFRKWLSSWRGIRFGR